MVNPDLCVSRTSDAVDDVNLRTGECYSQTLLRLQHIYIHIYICHEQQLPALPHGQKKHRNAGAWLAGCFCRGWTSFWQLQASRPGGPRDAQSQTGGRSHMHAVVPDLHDLRRATDSPAQPLTVGSSLTAQPPGATLWSSKRRTINVRRLAHACAPDMLASNSTMPHQHVIIHTSTKHTLSIWLVNYLRYIRPAAATQRPFTPALVECHTSHTRPVINKEKSTHRKPRQAAAESSTMMCLVASLPRSRARSASGLELPAHHQAIMCGCSDQHSTPTAACHTTSRSHP